MIENFDRAGHVSGMETKQASLLPASMLNEMRADRIGYRLMLIREAHGLKPAQMADMLGIERTYWSRFEGGKRVVTEQVAALLVDRFGVTLDFVILGRWGNLPVDLAERLRSAASATN